MFHVDVTSEDVRLIGTFKSNPDTGIQAFDLVLIDSNTGTSKSFELSMSHTAVLICCMIQPAGIPIG